MTTTASAAPTASACLRRAAFIDRDGVINEERNYDHRIEDFVLLPGAIAGLRLLQEAGFALVVVTNQAGIGRGLYTVDDYRRLEEHMVERLGESGIRLDGIYFCPHHPTKGIGDFKLDCDCRKPAPGMLLRAARELGLDLSRSVLVGDKVSDLQAGRAAGLARCVLVRSGHALAPEEEAQADGSFADLAEAAARLAGAP